jgi:uncharacterized protein YbcC (UPF0753/DUF2309 family)
MEDAMELKNATEVRQHWSEFIDTVARKHPLVFKRNRDVLTLFSLEQIDGVLSKYQFTLNIIKESDGTYTGILDELELAVNAESIDSLKAQIVTDLIQYSLDYMNDFDAYFHSPNRKDHFPYIFRVYLHQSDAMKVEEMITQK